MYEHLLRKVSRQSAILPFARKVRQRMLLYVIFLPSLINAVVACRGQIFLTQLASTMCIASGQVYEGSSLLHLAPSMLTSGSGFSNGSWYVLQTCTFSVLAVVLMKPSWSRYCCTSLRCYWMVWNITESPFPDWLSVDIMCLTMKVIVREMNLTLGNINVNRILYIDSHNYTARGMVLCHTVCNQLFLVWCCVILYVISCSAHRSVLILLDC